MCLGVQGGGKSGHVLDYTQLMVGIEWGSDGIEQGIMQILVIPAKLLIEPGKFLRRQGLARGYGTFGHNDTLDMGRVYLMLILCYQYFRFRLPLL